jgi:hypothetical protein
MYDISYITIMFDISYISWNRRFHFGLGGVFSRACRGTVFLQTAWHLYLQIGNLLFYAKLRAFHVFLENAELTARPVEVNVRHIVHLN